MLYNEEEVLRICKKYGIETVKRSGYPAYVDKEMDENFSVDEMLRQPVVSVDNTLISFSQATLMSPPISFDTQGSWNFYPSECSPNLIYEKGTPDIQLTSSISCNDPNSYAA